MNAGYLSKLILVYLNCILDILGNHNIMEIN